MRAAGAGFQVSVSGTGGSDPGSGRLAEPRLLNEWARTAADWWQQWNGDHSFEGNMLRVCERLVQCGGPVGRLLREGVAAPLKKLADHTALDVIFPLPLLRRGDAAVRAVGRKLKAIVLAWSNVLLVYWNLFYFGTEALAAGRCVASVAQRRVHSVCVCVCVCVCVWTTS